MGAAERGDWTERNGEALRPLVGSVAMAGRSLRTEPLTHGALVKAGWVVVTRIIARR